MAGELRRNLRQKGQREQAKSRCSSGTRGYALSGIGVKIYMAQALLRGPEWAEEYLCAPHSFYAAGTQGRQ